MCLTSLITGGSVTGSTAFGSGTGSAAFGCSGTFIHAGVVSALP